MKHLIKVSISLAKRCDSVEVILLNNMIDRLYELLTEDMKSALLRDFANLDTNYYAFILYSLVAKTKGFHPEYLIYKLEDLPKVFSDLREQPTASNWKRFVRERNYNLKKSCLDNLIFWFFSLCNRYRLCL